jgi:hypothetical protein
MTNEITHGGKWGEGIKDSTYLVERDDVDGHELGSAAHLQLLVDLQAGLIERVPRVVDLH